MKNKTSSFFRMDEQVIYTMLGVCVLSLALIAFRLISHKACVPITINAGRDTVFVNEVVHFTTNGNTEQSYSWNFGDGSLLENQSASVNHRYTQARTYTIKVIGEGECTNLQSVVVYERKPVLAMPMGPLLVVRQTAYVNEKVRFYDSSLNSTSWEWYFEDNPDVYSREREVYYSFTTPGNKKFSLRINKKPELTVTDDIYISEKPLERPAPGYVNPPPPARRPGGNPIIVIDKPVEKPLQNPVEEAKTPPAAKVEQPKVVEAKVAPELSNAQLEAALYDVNKGKKDLAFFESYFCGNKDVKVLYEKKEYKFEEFLNLLKNMKRVKKVSVYETKNQNQCILGMQITIKKKLLPL